MKTRTFGIALLATLAFSVIAPPTVRGETSKPTTQPVTSPPAPTLARAADGTVVLADAMPGTVICYTLDGSEPTTKSGSYLAPIALAHGGVVKARAFSLDRKQKSDAVEGKYDPLPGQLPLPSTVVPVTQDRSWPGYDWAKRHAEVCAAVRQRHPQVVFIGDSITHFWDQRLWKENYGKFDAVNLGYGWDRTENVLWRLQHGELESATPKVAVVMIGTNNMQINSVPEITDGVTAICQEIHKQVPQANILLLGIFPRGAKADKTRAKIAEINTLLAKLDGHDRVTFLDFGAKFLNEDGTISREIMKDYLHPTPKGYQIWVDAMQPTLSKLTGETKP
jgi:lysophospholipase L1-like esterase